MGDGTKHPVCPFYPEWCEVERHANVQHMWRKGVSKAEGVAHKLAKHFMDTGQYDGVTKPVSDAPVTEIRSGVPNAEPVPNVVPNVLTAKERHARFRLAHKDEYNAKARERMAAKRRKT